VNVVRGDNAQGKTSLLEAILFLTTSKSHRTNTDRDLAFHGADGFRVKGHVERTNRPVDLEAAWVKGAKRFKVNGINQARLSDILGKVRVVFFSPEDVQIVRGAAAQRRQFLDMELSQLSPAYLYALQEYRRALKQRNELLRADRLAGDLLDVWDAQLVRHGQMIVEERLSFIKGLGAATEAAYGRIAENERLRLAYRPDIGVDENYGSVIAAARNRDMQRGTTTRGPHRDDMQFQINDEAVRSFGSQGQQRSAALAVKLAEVELIKDRTGEYPIMMLDDVLAELDATRARRLLEALPDGVQCLLTTTELHEDAGLFGPDSAYFTIEGGTLAEG
jgi:DNA replication and repair protein RecF